MPVARSIACEAATRIAGSDLRTGHRIGSYRILGLLGAGGMGRVYRAEQTSLGRTVALKVLPPEIAGEKEFVARFLREARLAATVRHPHMVEVIDANLEPETGRPYLAMEWVEGGSLREKIDREGPLPESEAIHIAIAVADALAEAAKHRIIHRDIKPDNILLTAAGAPKLADLGLARQLGADTTRLTVGGMALGTPAYMAPEQADDSRTVDARADLYGLGATLFHMLTGAPPYEGENLFVVYRQVQESPVPDPRSRRREISASVAGIVMRCLAKQPEERYDNAAALRDALRAAQSGGDPVMAVSQTVAPSSRRVAAYLLDMVMLAPIWAALARGLPPVLGLAVVWAYFAALEARGATAGKLAFRLQVVGPDGRPPGMGRAALRFAAHLLSWLSWGLGFLPALGRRGQALHDWLSDTTVRPAPADA